ncbi:hypothetical protein ZWY2020_052525 [Hordeum vulgare]|nr:hypothetical protein ZWY2020_052525 [Hordeum vulgare]
MGKYVELGHGVRSRCGSTPRPQTAGLLPPSASSPCRATAMDEEEGARRPARAGARRASAVSADTAFQKLDAVAVREEEEAFRSSAAAGHTLLPLRHCIFSDHLTSVLAYRCLVREDDREAPNFLFESVEQASEGTNVVQGVLKRKAMEIVAKANRVTVMDHEMRTKKEQNRDLLILHCQ